MGNHHVLLVEPHDDTREMYAEYLRVCGFDVIETATTDEALPHIESADVVVTEFAVRGAVGGVQFIETLRDARATRRFAIIVVSTHAFEVHRNQAISAGADAFFAKPCAPDFLVNEIMRVLAPGGQSV